MSSNCNSQNRYKMVALEPISENEIAHYSFEGIEFQEKPLNPSEEFTQLVYKIDFKTLNGKEMEYTAPDVFTLDEESETSDNNRTNLTDSIRKHLNAALDEITALVDILTITRDSQYMQFRTVAKESSESNLTSYVVGKKMALAAAASTLLSSTARLGASNKDQQLQTSFYYHLAILRKEWRIQWYKNGLIGDLGLSSCGSTFPDLGSFQIFEESKSISTNETKKDDLSSLKVVLMHHQEGEPIMRIRVNKSEESDEMNSFYVLPEAHELPRQLDKISRAQNLLFMYELFSTLCWESNILSCPVFVRENKLVINLKDDLNLTVLFLILPEKHWFGYHDNETDEIRNVRQRNEQRLNADLPFSVNFLIFLRDLLRDKHRLLSSSFYSLVSPIAGPVQIPFSRRNRGPTMFRPIDCNPADYAHMVFLLPCLIDSVIFEKARQDVLSTLDSIAESVSAGMFVSSHVNMHQSMLNCTISVTIGCVPYSSIVRHFIVQLVVVNCAIQLDITSDTVRRSLVCESIDKEIFMAFFESQIWNFKIDIIRKIATDKHNWQMLDIRLTNCQKAIQKNVDVNIVLLSKTGTRLFSINGTKDARPYRLSVSYSDIKNDVPVEWKNIDLLRLQRKLLKCDLEVLDVVFTAFR